MKQVRGTWKHYLLLAIAVMASAITAAATPPVATTCLPSASTPRLISGSFGDCDENTVICLSCHDGKNAPAVGAQMGLQAVDSNAPVHSHPVCLIYREGGRELFPAAKISPKISLDQGRVGCLSCHDRDNPKRLAVNNAGSRLCLTCHNK